MTESILSANQAHQVALDRKSPYYKERIQATIKRIHADIKDAAMAGETHCWMAVGDIAEEQQKAIWGHFEDLGYWRGCDAFQTINWGPRPMPWYAPLFRSFLSIIHP